MTLTSKEMARAQVCTYSNGMQVHGDGSAVSKTLAQFCKLTDRNRLFRSLLALGNDKPSAGELTAEHELMRFMLDMGDDGPQSIH